MSNNYDFTVSLEHWEDAAAGDRAVEVVGANRPYQPGDSITYRTDNREPITRKILTTFTDEELAGYVCLVLAETQPFMSP
jgi:hypothetical protein